MSARVFAVKLVVEVSAKGLLLVNLLAVGVEHVPSEAIDSGKLKMSS